VTDAREYRIFISSPSDVWPERERLFRVITRIAGELGPVKLTAFHVAIGGALIGQGQSGPGLAAYQAALAILEALAAKEPGNAVLQKELQALQRKINEARRETTVTGSSPKP
jgi:hypothetical protein